MDGDGSRAKRPSDVEGEGPGSGRENGPVGFRWMLDLSFDWEYVEGPDGRLVYVSPSCERITGRSPEAFLRDPGLLEAIVHPEDRPSFHAHRLAFQGSVADASFQFRIVRPDRTVRILDHRGQGGRDAEGRFLGRRVSNRDITQRARSEEARRVTERRYRELASSITDMFYAFDRDLRYIFWNRAAEIATGIPAAFAIGRTWEEVFPEEQGGVFDRAYREVLQTGQPKTVEDRWRFGDRVFIHDVSIYPSGDGISVLAKDVSARRLAEEGLRDRDQRLRLVVDRSTLGVALSDMDGRLVEYNPAFQRMFGYTAAELHLKPIVEFAIPGDNPLGMDMIQDMIAGRRDQSEFETRYLHKDGHPLAVRVIGHLVRGPDGEPQCGLALFEDLSAQKMTRRELVALNETLEQRVAERTALAEQRAAQLTRLAAELTRAEFRERQRLVKILHDHIQQMLFAARLHLGGVAARLEEGVLRDSLRQAESLLGQAVEAARSLSVELSPPVLQAQGLAAALEWLCGRMEENYGLHVDHDLRLPGDKYPEDIRVFLFESVRELLFNVVKHSGVQKAHIGMAAGPDGRVRITVEDEGQGFDASCLQAPGGAAGIGLLSLRERLGVLGGAMTVDSAPGKGTRVQLVVPREPVRGRTGSGERPRLMNWDKKTP